MTRLGAAWMLATRRLTGCLPPNFGKFAGDMETCTLSGLTCRVCGEEAPKPKAAAELPAAAVA